jgi:hypothetical protein
MIGYTCATLSDRRARLAGPGAKIPAHSRYQEDDGGRGAPPDWVEPDQPSLFFPRQRTWLFGRFCVRGGNIRTDLFPKSFVRFFAVEFLPVITDKLF